MIRSIFAPAKRQLSFNEYLEETIIYAKRIQEVSPGKQRYTSAQFELALISFADIKRLRSEMDSTIEVEIPALKCDWIPGFDWLDLAVNYGDTDAIAYFQNMMKNQEFAANFQQYKKYCRPDCSLQNYEMKLDISSMVR